MSGSGFNPRARVGRDAVAERDYKALIQFQSTRPRGARLAAAAHSCHAYEGFNPRARVGRDLIFCSSVSSRTSFNPRARVGRD